ncbi:MAG TPA: tannase/feruloyl esterase family alpha/beta hydrolase [Vicinamibacterales bacterium]
MIRKVLIATFALTTFLSGSFAHAQAPAGFEVALVNVDGTKKVLGQLPPTVYAPRISPDGKRIAFETRDLSGADGPRLWTAEMSNIAGRKVLPLVVGQINWAPMWTPDGQRLVFIVSSMNQPDAVYWRRADGSGEAEHLIDTRAAEGWIAGGSQMRFLTLKESAGNRDYGIAVLDMSSRKVTPIIDLPNSAQHSSNVSPDGKWIAYASNETGRYEVWIEPLPQTGMRYQVTRDGGSHPMWLPDGQALYFDRDHQMFRLTVNTKDLSTRTEPTPLPIKGFAQAEYRRQFDLMPDGRQFLMLFPMTTRAAAETTALPSGACTALQGFTIPAPAIGLPTGGATVETAVQVGASDGKNVNGEFCKVTGVIKNTTASTAVFEFEVNLPATWNRRAVQMGGGGLDGTLINGLGPYRQQPPGADTPLKQGYVTLGSNGGHKGAPGFDARFGTDDEALINYGKLSIKKTHDAAVAIIKKAYGRAPERFYVIPGFAHGYGVFDARFDALTPLQNWVENGQAPQGLTAMDGNPNANRTRPLCEYPAWPKFTGASGTENSAASFSCVAH